MGDQLGISKPATVLIEKVSDFVGGVFEPRQIERKAKAHAKADKIKAESDIEIRNIQERANERRNNVESKKQENIEKITAGAVKQLNDDAKPENIEDDWIANFFNNCSLVSDEEMQKIWSKILADEGNRPGSFSKRAINIVMNLDKSDIELFTNLSTFVWYFGPSPIPLVYDETDEFILLKESILVF